MIDLSLTKNQVQYVSNFHDLMTKPFQGKVNATCWTRNLIGDFSEIVKKISLEENMVTLEEEELRALELSEHAELARQILLDDLKLLSDHGAVPTLNLIKSYQRDDSYPFFRTDVYSWHVDRAPIPGATILCTYHGDASEILPNSQGKQKILIPEIRAELKKLYSGGEEGFDSFLEEHFFDLHYQANQDAQPFSLGIGHLWRLAIDHPQSQVPPCLHRAPMEKSGLTRLMMIC